MVELLAMEAIDGLLFYRERDSGTIFALRSPYVEQAIVDEAAVARAVGDHGFEPVGRTFRSVDEMVDYVRRAQREATAQLPRRTAGDLAYELLRVAPASALRRFVDRIERELLPRQAYAEAQNILAAILERTSTTTGETADLERRARELLRRASLGTRTGLLGRRLVDDEEGRRSFRRRGVDESPPSHPGI